MCAPLCTPSADVPGEEDDFDPRRAIGPGARCGSKRPIWRGYRGDAGRGGSFWVCGAQQATRTVIIPVRQSCACALVCRRIPALHRIALASHDGAPSDAPVGPALRPCAVRHSRFRTGPSPVRTCSPALRPRVKASPPRVRPAASISLPTAYTRLSSFSGILVPRTLPWHSQLFLSPYPQWHLSSHPQAFSASPSWLSSTSFAGSLTRSAPTYPAFPLR